MIFGSRIEIIASVIIESSSYINAEGIVSQSTNEQKLVAALKPARTRQNIIDITGLAYFYCLSYDN